MSLAEIEPLVERTLKEMGLAPVLVRFDAHRLQILIERADEAPVAIEDCAQASRALSDGLDALIDSAYTLEVSSAGVERPLVRPADYDRFRGRKATIELRALRDRRRRFRGVLAGRDGDRILLDEGGERVTIELADIAKAKLDFVDGLAAAPAERGEETKR